MFVELNNILDFDLKNPPVEKYIFCTECGTEAGFMIHHLVSLFLKGGYNVCLVAFTQSYGHYNNVGAKLGVNLNASKDSGNFIFLEGLKLLGDEILTSSAQTKKEGVECVKHQILDTHRKDDGGKTLFEMIESKFKSLKNWESVPTLILIDDLSVLVHLGVPPLDVVWIVHYLQTLCATPSSVGCLATFMHLDQDTEDEETLFLTKTLKHSSDITVEITGLPSGYSKEVHGQIRVKWNDTNGNVPVEAKTKTAQYKISEKNVNVFAKGLSSAVL